jgi:hypothetical protein
MLQEMDHMEESCVFYVKVALFDQLEQNIFCLLTVITFGIVMIPLQHDMMLPDSFMYDHGDFLKKSLLHFPLVVKCHFFVLQWWDFCCRSPLCISLNKLTTFNQYTANRENFGYPWNLLLYAVVFILIRTCKLAVTHSILTGTKLYISQDFRCLCVIIVSPVPLQQCMDQQTPQEWACTFKLSQLKGASSKALPAWTKQWYRHLSFPHNLVNTATKSLNQGPFSKTDLQTRHSKKLKYHAIGCE